jgi:flagellar hook-length control protein FliK
VNRQELPACLSQCETLGRALSIEIYRHFYTYTLEERTCFIQSVSSSGPIRELRYPDTNPDEARHWVRTRQFQPKIVQQTRQALPGSPPQIIGALCYPVVFIDYYTPPHTGPELALTMLRSDPDIDAPKQNEKHQDLHQMTDIMNSRTDAAPRTDRTSGSVDKRIDRDGDKPAFTPRTDEGGMGDVPAKALATTSALTQPQTMRVALESAKLPPASETVAKAPAQQDGQLALSATTIIAAAPKAVTSPVMRDIGGMTIATAPTTTQTPALTANAALPAGNVPLAPVAPANAVQPGALAATPNSQTNPMGATNTPATNAAAAVSAMNGAPGSVAPDSGGTGVGSQTGSVAQQAETMRAGNAPGGHTADAALQKATDPNSNRNGDLPGLGDPRRAATSVAALANGHNQGGQGSASQNGFSSANTQSGTGTPGQAQQATNASGTTAQPGTANAQPSASPTPQIPLSSPAIAQPIAAPIEATSSESTQLLEQSQTQRVEMHTATKSSAGQSQGTRMDAAAIAALASRMSRKLQDGATRFQVRIDPPELGRVDVRVEIQRDGRTRAHLTVERPEALQELQRHARQIERALVADGIQFEQEGFSLSLADAGSRGNPFAEAEHNGTSPDHGSEAISQSGRNREPALADAEVESVFGFSVLHPTHINLIA